MMGDGKGRGDGALVTLGCAPAPGAHDEGPYANFRAPEAGAQPRRPDPIGEGCHRVEYKMSKIAMCMLVALCAAG